MPSPFDAEWASNLIHLRLNIPNCWWPGFSNTDVNSATLVEIDPGEIDKFLRSRRLRTSWTGWRRASGRTQDTHGQDGRGRDGRVQDSRVRDSGGRDGRRRRGRDRPSGRAQDDYGQNGHVADVADVADVTAAGLRAACETTTDGTAAWRTGRSLTEGTAADAVDGTAADDGHWRL